MAYIGNTATTQAFTPAVDYFNGDGSTVAFTLSKPVASVAQVQAVIENVPQNPGSAYTVSGNTITFTSAPPSGTANIYVYYTSPITQVIQPGQETVGTDQLVGGTVDTSADATLNGVKVGRGAGSVSTNTAVGASALAANTTGSRNTAVGQYSLIANTEGAYNSAVGRYALASNTTGSYNTALGQTSLYSNTTASNNTAVGYQAGYTQTGGNNTFFGYRAGYSVSTGAQNIGIGLAALENATTGTYNACFGYRAGDQITTGSKNTILGAYNGNQGGVDIRTASNHIVISDGDGTPRQFHNASGHFYLTSINTGAGTNALRYSNVTGQVTYDTSSLRYKDNVRDSVYGLSHVLQMRSTQFEYKDDGRSDVGLIAEELQPIIPELVGIDKQGRADSVSYDRMVSVLVKAIQELNAKVEAQAAEIAALKGQ